MKESLFTIRSDERKCVLKLGSGLLRQAGSLIESTFRRFNNIAVLTVPPVRALYGDGLLSSLEPACCSLHVIEVPDSEHSKSPESLYSIYDQLIEYGFDRFDLIITFGGGMVGDLGGYAAATYMRGMPLITIPTTLLAQTDSALGGKVAVNHHRGKNLIGTFYDPLMIISDIDTLSSLPMRTFKAGLGEVLKYAIALDCEFYDYLDTHLDSLLARSPEVMLTTVYACCQHKMNVVEQDRLDKGLRSILNFGHTVGHGLEMASHGKLQHGEAVTMGMIAAMELSLRYTDFQEEDFLNCVALLKRLDLEFGQLELSRDVVMSFLFQDKKRCGDSLRFTLLKSRGKASLAHDIPESHIREALDHLPDFFPRLVLT